MSHPGFLPTLVLVSLALSACGITKSTSTDDDSFPETKLECQPTAVANRFLVTWKDGTVSIEHAADRQAFIAGILEPNRKDIQFVENDQIVRHYNDVPVQAEETVDADWGQKMVHAPDVWAQGVNGQGITVAVIDSGVDIKHPQLANQIAINEAEVADGIDNDGNGLVDDIYGFDFEDMTGHVRARSEHGTHVAGIIAAEHSAGQVQGLAEQAKILPLNFMNDKGEGYISAAIAAILYAESRGVRVINASWGGDGCSTTLRDVIAKIEERGVLFVAAAGNAGRNLDRQPEYPAAFTSPNQLTIGASTPRDLIISWSNYSNTLVHLIAPGYGIFSTVPDGGTKILSGTSMATPFVTGAAALLMSSRPKATLAQIRQALLEGVDLGNHPVATHGRLNVQKSLARLQQLVP